MSQPISVAAFYRFVAIDDCVSLQKNLLNICKELGIKGTILLGYEGINSTIAGEQQAIENFFANLRLDERFKNISYKLSEATESPFMRLKVKIKNEIVTLGVGHVPVLEDAGTYITASEWAEFISKPDVVTIDTRNDYEVALGSFVGALDPKTCTFRDFPAWAKNWMQDKNPEELKVAMFCTGGIRCEKSTAFMRNLGFQNVYHLQGGILQYLEETKNLDKAWQGECFVFDERVAVDDNLQATGAILCNHCGNPITRALKPYESAKDNKESLCICCRSEKNS
jgi:UPF0176 protein